LTGFDRYQQGPNIYQNLLKIEHPVMCCSNNSFCYTACALHVACTGHLWYW